MASELARCLKVRDGRECGEYLLFQAPNAYSRLQEICPVCNLGEPPKRLRLEHTAPEEPLPPPPDPKEGEGICAYEPCSQPFKPKRSANQKYCGRTCSLLANHKNKPRPPHQGSGITPLQAAMAKAGI
jgi:hypothetical protein